MDWLQNNYIELIGALTGLIYLYLEIKQNIWLWPVGIITSAFYIIIFYQSKFYADMGLQVYYLVISIYGWYHWLFGAGSSKNNDLPITKTSPKIWGALTIVTALLFGVMAVILIKFTDSPVPYGDALATAMSITATWMLARKLIEHWWIWVFVNLLSLGLFIWKELYPTSILFFFYFSMAIVGYYEWRKELVYKSKDKNQS